MASSEMRIACTAHADAARALRHALSAFLDALDIEPPRRDDIVVAVGEAVGNAIEHGYGDRGGGFVELAARAQDDGTIQVDVRDRGRFVERRNGTPGRGFGLRIVRAIARDVTIDVADGTRVHMTFDARRAAS